MSTVGGLAGLLLALSSSRVVLNLASTPIPRSWEIGFDWRVFCFLAAISVGVGVLFGLAPALFASQVEVQADLNDTQGSHSVGYGSSKWTGRRRRDSLVTAEIMMAFILFTGAALLSEAFLRLQSTPAGLVADKVLTLHVSVALRDYRAAGSYGRYLRH
ncbi:MAG: hypothetical protein M3Y57_11825 [Acidobacteriota bacterium]|nr:hypothetical protein [Acidobacteriota bacterium]